MGTVTTAGSTATASVGERASGVGRQLASASASFLASLRTPIRTASDLIKAAGVNKDLASRFLNALGKHDPLAVVYYMPGVESLRRLSRGARARSGDPEAIRAFEEAIDAYEQFLQDEVGGRHALDAIASAWLPEARERFEATSRQMAYRAAANLRGVECQTVLSTMIIHPGADPERYDGIALFAQVGLRRLRPSVPLTISTFDHRDDTAGRPAYTLDGRPIRHDDPMAEVLTRFGRTEPPPMRAVRSGSCTAFQLVGDALGADTASDIVFGEYTPGLYRRWAMRPDDIAAHMYPVETPAQRLVQDVLVHPEVWDGRPPELMLYNACVRGTALPYDRSRDTDRVDLLDTARHIGDGVSCCRVAEMPGYVALLRWACEQRGWDPDRLRVFRCDSRYPVYGVQYVMAFRLKDRPAGA